MSVRRMVVAYETVETRDMRIFRQAWSGDYASGTTPAGLGRYWCAADRVPSTDRTSGTGYADRAIYRTTRVPEDAVCEECHIGIRELQAALTDVVRSVKAPAPGGTE